MNSPITLPVTLVADNAPPLPVPPRAPVLLPDGSPLTLQVIQDQLRTKVVALLGAEPAKIAALTQEIQRLRIASELLKELDNNTPSESLYRELVLLMRMFKVAPAGDGEDDATEAAAVEAALEREGLDPMAAIRMAKVFETMSREGANAADDPAWEPKE